MIEETAIVWFRRDLRLVDNPALDAALDYKKVIPLYIHAPEEAGAWRDGAASRWWLHHSLKSLEQELRKLGSRLIIRTAESSADAIAEVSAETRAKVVFWNRLYEPEMIARDTAIKSSVSDAGMAVKSYNSALLIEPWELLKGDRTPYKVFTPFWKAAVQTGIDKGLKQKPRSLPTIAKRLGSATVESLELLPKIPWDQGFYDRWRPGEAGATRALRRFLADALSDYAEHRDQPFRQGTSSLSPHMHFGEIGPRQIVRALLESEGVMVDATGKTARDRFAAELGWREFAHYLLFHFPHTAEEPLDKRYQRFPWARDFGGRLAAWQQGETGIPLVDAGMRELWNTGWMHNRVRMIVASFLTKNLLIPWQEGARWFWDTLVDADLASNTFGWQWSAGCGADAAPFFRIFNPVLQGERFDPNGEYVQRWLPQLGRLPRRYMHKPWAADQAVLRAADLRLGKDYPQPIADLKRSRELALQAFATIKNRNPDSH